MARQLAWMRTFPGSLFAAGLATRVWWQAGERARVGLLLTPARIRGWKGIFRQIAAWTPPLPDSRHLAILLALLAH